MKGGRRRGEGRLSEEGREVVGGGKGGRRRGCTSERKMVVDGGCGDGLAIRRVASRKTKKQHTWQATRTLIENLVDLKVSPEVQKTLWPTSSPERARPTSYFHVWLFSSLFRNSFAQRRTVHKGDLSVASFLPTIAAPAAASSATDAPPDAT